MSREQELAACLRGVADSKTRTVNEEIAALLDELHAVKTAALPANVDAIRREHASVDYAQGLSGSEANEAHRNRGVLLEIVRLQVLLIAGMKRQVEEAERRTKISADNEHRMQRAEVDRVTRSGGAK